MSNYLQVKLGGQKQGLLFVVGTLYKARDADVLAQEFIGKVEEDIRQLSVIIYAALLSNYKTQKKQQDFSFEDVLDWSENIETTDEIEAITNAFTKISKKTAPQEGGQDTRQQAA